MKNYLILIAVIITIAIAPQAHAQWVHTDELHGVNLARWLEVAPIFSLAFPMEEPLTLWTTAAAGRRMVSVR